MRPDKLIDRRNRKGMRKALDMIERAFRLSRLPGASIHPWFNPSKTDMRWLPINEDIEVPESSAVPLALLDRLIEEASHRVIYDYCGCRYAYECKHYPVDVGCLLLGDSALDGKSKSRREAGIPEAKEHALRAVDAGLVPVVGKARIDNALFGIPDRGRLLTVCFCCECCCITRFTRHTPLRGLERVFPRLDGVVLEVGDECTGCGECVGRCYIGAITLEGGKARIGEVCRGCGRCAGACLAGNIRLRIEDPEFLDKAYERIRSYVKFD